MLGDPEIPLWITEGVKKADCGALHGLCIVALSGVWNWLGTNTAGRQDGAAPTGATIALNGRRVIIAFDGDMARKPSVPPRRMRPGRLPGDQGCHVEYLHLPDTDDEDRAGRLPDDRAHRRGPVESGQADPAADTEPERTTSRTRARAEARTGATDLARPRRTTCSATGWARTTTPTRWTSARRRGGRELDDGSDPSGC